MAMLMGTSVSDRGEIDGDVQIARIDLDLRTCAVVTGCPKTPPRTEVTTIMVSTATKDILSLFNELK
jgi:hypothetical protein